MIDVRPTVFAVKNEYQIMVPSVTPSLMWIKVGDKNYYDDSNGVLRSHTRVHCIKVPAKELDEKKSYTVCLREMIERGAYGSKTGEVEETVFEFKPLASDNFRVYHISDAHNMTAEPIRAAQKFGNIDLLVLNGDIPNDGGTIENFDNIYEISWEITKGMIPAVFSRGNHDMRGVFAEKLAEYTPTDNGKSYYTFRVGDLWGIVLDCGEDKPDNHEEYGNTVCCHDFRLRQIKFIKEVIENSRREYAAEGVKYRVVISHNPFTELLYPPFDIEREIYSEWAALLKEYVRPNVFLAGHFHRLTVNRCGSEQDMLGQPCDVVIGGMLRYGEKYYAGAGLEFYPEKIDVTFTSSAGEILAKDSIKI